MIPNSLSSTGPYAGLWSHLKSIDHALARVQNGEISDLDKERLGALIEILRGGLSATVTDAPETPNFLVLANEDQPDYRSAFELRSVLSSVGEFTAWKSKSKMPVDTKVQKLIDALHRVIGEKRLFPHDLPQEELSVLQAISKSLLSDAESSL